MKTKLKFEAFPEFVGKPKTELYEHLQKNYAGQLAKESDINKKDIPKDGNWYYFFGSTFCDRDGLSEVPCLCWDGEELFFRRAAWLECAWGSGNRVVLLLETEISLKERILKLEEQVEKLLKVIKI